jgi:hypothetical protein
VSSESIQPSRQSGHWPLAIVVALIAALGLAAAGWFAVAGRPAKPLEGKLMVYVRSAQRAVEPLAVEEKGALPARPGGIMSLQAQFNEPAFTYLIWLDTQGQIVPLYPWNTKELETTDVSKVPPVRQPTKMIYSPLLGGGWTFGEHPGVDTVLLLARRTPLPQQTALAPLLELPPGDRSASEEPTGTAAMTTTSIKMTLANTDVTVTQDGENLADEVSFTQEPLVSLLKRLQPHFELIHAVQFPHAASTPASEP